MNLLSELSILIKGLKIPFETGLYKGKPPNTYIVITPLVDTLEGHSDNRPRYEIQEARLSLFDKGNYISLKNQLVRTLLDADILITDSRYIEHEDGTGYFHYAIDVAKEYELED